MANYRVQQQQLFSELAPQIGLLATVPGYTVPVICFRKIGWQRQHDGIADIHGFSNTQFFTNVSNPTRLHRSGYIRQWYVEVSFDSRRLPLKWMPSSPQANKCDSRSITKLGHSRLSHNFVQTSKPITSNNRVFVVTPPHQYQSSSSCQLHTLLKYSPPLPFGLRDYRIVVPQKKSNDPP